MHEHDLAVLKSKLGHGTDVREQRDRILTCGPAALPLLCSHLRKCAGEELGEDAIACAELIAAVRGDEAARSLVDLLLSYDDSDGDLMSDVLDERWRAREAVRAGLLALGPVAIPHVRTLVANANGAAAELAGEVLSALLCNSAGG